jgi:hypothetical protein
MRRIMCFVSVDLALSGISLFRIQRDHPAVDRSYSTPFTSIADTAFPWMRYLLAGDGSGCHYA